MVILSIISALIFALIIFECIFVYLEDGILNEMMQRKVMNSLHETILDDYDRLCFKKRTDIRISPSITTKYYLYGRGHIFRWSPLHKLIDRRFKELKREKDEKIVL